jgi:hypothetical protein
MPKPGTSKTGPLSYSQLVKKIIADPTFAKSVHKLVCAARGGDKNAVKKINALYQLTSADLKKCCLSAEFVRSLDCEKDHDHIPPPPKTTPTTIMHLDFAATV